MFVMFATDGSCSRNDWSKLSAVGCHGMPDCGVKKEFSGIYGVGGNDVQNALFHLAIFPRAKPSRPLIVVRGVPGFCKFGNNDLEAGVIASFPAEEGEKVGNGLVGSVYAPPFLTHEKVVWTPSEVGIADGDNAGIVPGSC